MLPAASRDLELIESICIRRATHDRNAETGIHEFGTRSSDHRPCLQIENSLLNRLVRRAMVGRQCIEPCASTLHKITC